MATFKQPVTTQREDPTSVTITSASPEIRQAQQPDPMDRITVDAFPDDFNLDDYILSDMSDVWGDMAPQITNNAGYDQTDSKTFQAMSRALTDHKKATQGYTSSWIYGDRKIPLSEEAIKNKTFPGYEATEEGLQQLTNDLVDSFIGTMNAFPKAGAFESLSSDQKEFVLRYTKNANYETASGEQQNELFTNPRTEVGDAEKTITLPTESYGDLTVTSIPDMTYKSSDGFNQMYVDTDQGRFVFLTNDYLNKGFVEDSPFAENRKFQNYSRGLLNPETRSEILGSAVPVDLSDIEGSLSDYGVSTGNNVSLDKLTNTQGILIPVEQAEKLDNAYSALGGTTNEIKGFAMVDGKPTYIQDDSYNTTIQYSETGTGSFSDINDTRGIVTDTGVRYQKGGMFDNFTGIGFIDNTLGGISDALAGVEDIGREGIEGVDAALQNPYVNAVVKTIAAVSPDPITKAIAAGIDAYTTVDSGEDLSAGQIVNLATSTAGAIQASGGAGGTMSADGGPPQTGGATDTSAFDSAVQAATDETVQKIAGAGASIIDGADPIDVVVDVFSDKIIEGVANTADTVIGKEAGDAIRDNTDITNTVIDVAQGDDVSTAIANNLGDRAAEAIGADTTNEIALVKAGLSTGAGLDQGLDTDEALLEGAETYFDEGGTVDLDIDPNLTGDLDLAFGDINIDLPDIGLEDAIVALPAVDLPEVDIDIPEVELPEVDVEIPEVEIPEVDVPEVDIDIPEVDVEIPEVDVPEVDIEIPEVDIPEVDIEIPEVDVPEVDVELPEVDVEKPDFEGPDIEEPDISKPTLDLMQFAGLLSTTGGGQAPAEQQERSQYQTQFDFLAGLQPLGMLGNFQRRS